MPDIVTTFEDRAGGRIARVVIDNRAKLNVLNSALSAALEAAFRRLAADDMLRAVVLAGVVMVTLFG